MLVFGHEEKVEYSRDCCFRMLERLKMDNWALGKSKVSRTVSPKNQITRPLENFPQNHMQFTYLPIGNLRN